MAEVLMYGVELESRCLANVPAAQEDVTFLVGTCNMKVTNQVCVVQLDGNGIVARSRSHPQGEVRALASDPNDADQLVTAASNYGRMSALHSLNLLRMTDSLEEVKSVTVEDAIYSIAWEADNNRLGTVDAKKATVYDMGEVPFKVCWDRLMGGSVWSVVWSAHSSGNIVGVVVDRHVCASDVRTKDEGQCIRDAHSLPALHMSFNPNLQKVEHVVASVGREGELRVWDWRNGTSPLFSLSAHAHWATQVHFHPVHDQLILSAGCDASLLLTSARSISSDVRDEWEEGEQPLTVLPDGALERIEEHEDSIYSCAWSTADPWTFASLSFDGRILISHLNREHKYALMRL